MNWEKLFSVVSTGHVIVAVITIAALSIIWVFEAMSRQTEDPEDNLNFIMYDWARRYYIITYAWGVIGGHLFLGSFNIYISNANSLITISIVAACIIAYDIWGKHGKISKLQRLLSLIFGVLMGHFVWTMNGIL